MAISRVKNTKKEKTTKEIKEHNDKVVHDYIVNLTKTIKEKKLGTFWTFADRTGFKKIKNMHFDDMCIALKEDVELYKNRQLVNIKIISYIPPKKHGVHLLVNIWVIFTDDKANIKGFGVKGNSASIIWNTEDFKFTKFSLKLVEAIMYPIADWKYIGDSISGSHITSVADMLKKKKINLSDHIAPLAGLI